MVKTQLVSAFIICCCIIACSQNHNFGPGYQFDLFKNTPNWDLAKAVEREDIKKIKEIIKEGNVNIDLQEPKFGRSLLLLAVGNDKLESTKALLEAGANVNARDSGNSDAINEAAKLYLHDKYSYKIIELLIKYGADVNSLEKGKGIDSVNYVVPLCGVVENLSCAKLLLDNGANPYVNKKGAHVVWLNLFGNFEKENFFVAHYMIVEKKLPIPGIISYGSNDKKITIYDLLNDEDFPKDQKKRKAKQEILDYLKQIDFPKNGVYQETDTTMKK